MTTAANFKPEAPLNGAKLSMWMRQTVKNLWDNVKNFFPQLLKAGLLSAALAVPLRWAMEQGLVLLQNNLPENLRILPSSGLADALVGLIIFAYSLFYALKHCQRKAKEHNAPEGPFANWTPKPLGKSFWDQMAVLTVTFNLLIFAGLFFIIPGLYFYMRYGFAEFLALFQEFPPLKSLSASSKIFTRANCPTTKMFLMTVLVLVISILLQSLTLVFDFGLDDGSLVKTVLNGFFSFFIYYVTCSLRFLSLMEMWASGVHGFP